MLPRNTIAVILILLSFVALIPGLTGDLITISASLTMAGHKLDLFKQTRSILQTIRTLHQSGNDFVAGLIMLFSVVVPFVKGALLLVVLLMRSGVARLRIFAFVRSISKWAMADVFVVGVFVAYLTAEATDPMDAQLGPGFYYFVAYCLISLLALQFMYIERDNGPVEAPSRPPRETAQVPGD